MICHEGARDQGLAALLPTTSPDRVWVAIGPEGGFTDDEIVLAREHGFVVAGLGPRVLRAETASLAALAIVGFVLGDLGGAMHEESAQVPGKSE